MYDKYVHSRGCCLRECESDCLHAIIPSRHCETGNVNVSMSVTWEGEGQCEGECE